MAYLVKNNSLSPGVYSVPKELDEKVAALKLSSMGKSIDKLSDEQKAYLAGY